MTVAQILHRAVRDLWLAVAELVLSTNDDQPEESDLASAEHVAQLAVEIQARLAEAMATFSRKSEHEQPRHATSDRRHRATPS